MSFWTKLLIILGIIKNKPKPEPPQPPVNPYRPVAIITVANATVKLDGAEQVDGGSAVVGVTNGDGYYCWTHVPKSIGPSHVWLTCEGYVDYDSHVELSQGDNATNHDLKPGGTIVNPTDIILPALVPLKPPVVKRTGQVRAWGRTWVDDTGEFYPLGATLFWALRGWKFERDRLKQNLAYLQKYAFDYVRILGEVGWPGNDIDPTKPEWADYDQVLAEFIDCAYDEFGLRTELTIVGGGTKTDYYALAQRIIPIVNARKEKVISIEITNENQMKDLNLAQRILQYLKGATNILIAVTDPGNAGLPEVDGNKQFISQGATYTTLHLDRDDSKVEWKWRHTRQSWDSKGLPFLISHNEPGGPRSSVAEYPEPIHNAFNRVTGIINGLCAYVLHNGAGVAGQVDPVHNRPANLWEVPGIDDVMAAVRGLDKYLPGHVADGLHTRLGLGNHPFTADALWVDGADHGVVRDYAVSVPGGWVQVLLGIKDRVVMQATGGACTVDLIDLVSGETETRTVAAGAVTTITPKTRDSRGYGGILVIGKF